MIWKLFGLILMATLLANAGEHNVIELTDDDFSTKIDGFENALVMFYAPWCGHCKRLKPEFAKAASEFKGNDFPITLAKVDCTEGGQKTCNKFPISGYPTLIIFKNGKFSQEYNGPREAKGIINFIKAQVGPSAKDLLSIADFDKFLDSTKTSIIGFFEEESDLKGEFLKYADKNRGKFRFAYTSAKDVLEKQDEKNSIVLFRSKHLQNTFEPTSVKFEGKTSAELADFVTKKNHGLVGHRTRDNVQDFKNPLVVAYYSVDYVKNPKGTNYWRNRVLKVAKEFEGKINFAISSKDDFQHELNEYGYDFISDKPILLARDANKQKYSMRDEFSVDNLREFVTKLLAGRLEPYIKSEPIPENNNSPVKIAVAKNFADIVINNDKDTLIEFYAPWCGHCKKLALVYDELGEKLQNEDVSIVKMDATVNDIPPEFQVQGFPTLFWLPKHSKDKPIPYNGGRKLDDFIKYIAKHATNELKNYDRNGKEKKTEL